MSTVAVRGDRVRALRGSGHRPRVADERGEDMWFKVDNVIAVLARRPQAKLPPVKGRIEAVTEVLLIHSSLPLHIQP